MKKVLFLVLVFSLAFQASAFAETKIGVVSLQRIVKTCDYGKEVATKLKAKFEPLQNDIEREAEEIRQLESEIKNQDLALKLEAQQDRQRDFRRKVRDHQDSVAAYRQKLQSETQKLQKPIIEKVSVVLGEYGKKNGYSLILEGTNIAVYVGEKIDLTDAIIAELNKMKKARK